MRWQAPPTKLTRGWRTSWRLKDLLDDRDDSLATATAARSMHERLEQLRARSFGGLWAADEEIEQISDEFHTIGYVDGDDSADVVEFNGLMNALYDWADDQRVWID